ncbi:RidA family protein [Mesorhizobium sp. LNJC391B00]|uniref:RidA family protein n=1 Tax=Mesorhizobium sp. LNJC391B00 TaxID=1287273 RepID=UPI0003CF32EA|nr:RidA family protein [Mesorhizobium sp. LNJC391B00]ESY27139.1 endoribonuclease L-PSP [Mesorhizobium sp. LNJC391B00]
MELVTHKKFKNGRLMPWGKGTVVSGAKGTVYLCGNTATSADYDPAGKKGGGFAGDAAAQWREVLGNIKSDLEELGSGLDHLIRLTFFVKGPFPDGGVLSSPNFRLDVPDAFFAEHCPKHCSDNNPPPSEVIGVAALAQADIVIEIVAVAALPD